jgi:NADPH:quinone reductase-like Zn-dependent oxidoreductase
MSSVPATIKAVTVQSDKSVKVTEVPGPKSNQHDEIIVKVYSCAQNPTDWKSVAGGRAPAGNIIGNDIAGVVVEVGSDVTNVKVGD